MKLTEAIRKSYTTCAVITFTATLLLYLVITALLSYESSKEVEFSKVNPRIYNRIIARDITSLHKVYPAMTTDEIRMILFETWTRPYLYEPFTQFRERPYAGRYVHVDPNGFRAIVNQKRWPPKNEFYHSNNQPMMTERLRKVTNTPIRETMFTEAINDLKQKTVFGHKWFIKNSDLKGITHGSSTMKKRVVENYLQNMQIISAVSRAYNVMPLFVWQPVPTYKYDLNYHAFGNRGFGEHIASKFGYQYMRNVVLENPPKGHFLWLANIQEDIKKPLYVDKVHYTGEFSRLFAKEIAGYISEQNLMSVIPDQTGNSDANTTSRHLSKRL